MCLDLPALVISCGDLSAEVEIDGSRRIEVATFAVPGLMPGDWVRVIAGVAVERIDAIAASQIRQAVLLARAATTGGETCNAT
jgi:hydrogenase maturation factor